MTDSVKPLATGNRDRLIEAATAILEAHPDDDLSLRAVCAAVGVQMPTLYHYFGSKQGLLDAVVAAGFDDYLALKRQQGASARPIADIRIGWDQHVEWGLGHPAVYALMWKAAPGRRTPAAERALEALRAQTSRADELGQLVVAADEAADLVLAGCVGVTLFLITSPERPAALSPRTREAVIATISRVEHAATPDTDDVPRLAALLAAAIDPGSDGLFAPEEEALLRRWLMRLAHRDR